jgi:xylitol oxidase
VVSNWAGNVTYSASTVSEPTSVDELAELVAGSTKLRVLGAGHSFNRIADTTGTLVSLARMPPEVVVLPDRATVRAAAGLPLSRLAQALWDDGLALPTMPSLPHITVAGACLTATHGSGDAVGSLAAAVRAVHLVTATGERAVIKAGDPDFEGSVVGLGALGVVTALELAVRPAFEVEQRVYDGLSWDALTEHVDGLLGCAYSVSVFTALAGPSRIWIKRRTDDPAPDLSPLGVGPADGPQHPVRGADPVNTTDQLGPAGPWHHRLPHFRPEFSPSTGAELQSELLVPREHAADALRLLKQLEKAITPLVQTIEVRSVAAEPLWLSPTYQRAGVGLHFTWGPDESAVWPVVRAVERALAPLRPRPHWGKLFGLPPAELAARYPRWADFGRLRRRADPGGTFGNALLDSWFPR